MDTEKTYLLILGISFIFGLFSPIKNEGYLNFKKLLLINLLLLFIVIIQFFAMRWQFSVAGNLDLIFSVLFHSTGIVLFTYSLRQKRGIGLKIYAGAVFLTTSVLIIFIGMDGASKTQKTSIAHDHELRKVSGSLLTHGDKFSIAVNKYFFFEKTVPLKFREPIVFHTKSLLINSISKDFVDITIFTTDGDTLHTITSLN